LAVAEAVAWGRLGVAEPVVAVVRVVIFTLKTPIYPLGL